LRLWLLGQNAGVTMDSLLYVTMADSLAVGARATGPAHHGYPALIALVHTLVPGHEWPGRLVSLIAGVALVPLVYRLARVTLPRPAAALAAALVAAHPVLAVYSGPIMTESSFVALGTAAILLVERRRPGPAGALLGLAYSIRPEAAVIALASTPLTRRGVRGALLLLAGFALAASPYLGYLRWTTGTWTLTPKTALVRPAFANRAAAEWRVGRDSLVLHEEPRSLVERVRWAAPSIAKSYAPRLGGHLHRVTQAWPWPLLVLSLLGLLARRGAVLAPLSLLLVFPLLSSPIELRFSQLFLPTLAVLAAAGVSWLAARGAPRRGRRALLVPAALALVAASGIVWAWRGAPGFLVREFDDGPMKEMRATGSWLHFFGKPNALVMDRKVYVAFFAGMRHVQLPADDYDTVIDYAVKNGVDYLVVEEYVVEKLRPAMAPLLDDPAFRAAEHRLRPVHLERGKTHTGVAVFAVVRDSLHTALRPAAGGSAARGDSLSGPRPPLP